MLDNANCFKCFSTFLYGCQGVNNVQWVLANCQLDYWVFWVVGGAFLCGLSMLNDTVSTKTGIMCLMCFSHFGSPEMLTFENRPQSF